VPSTESMALPLRSVIEGELARFPHKLSESGSDVRLSPRAAQDFALIVHELTTNALKHGALSRPEGRVEIACRRNDDGHSFTFDWRESGGPEVKPPEGPGFGRTILKDLARGFATSVKADYPPEGFHYELRTELARIEVMDPPDVVA
jgi:two-component sensor histidine kinase